MTPEFEARVKKAVDDGYLPGVTMLVKDKSGKIDYDFSYGPTSLKPDAPPITTNTMLTMASLTKLITACCILKMVEGNILDINEDITKYVETLAKQPVLQGFDDEGQPILVKRETPFTLRHLLTHTAGTGYILKEEPLAKWAKATGRPLPVPLRHSPLSGGMSVDSRWGYPILFEPGTGWVYGSAMDWAGRLIEKLTGTFFDDYMHEHVLEPVGVPRGAITFHPGRFDQPTYDIMAEFGQRSTPEGTLEPAYTEYDNDNEAFGGEGLFGGMGSYMKVLHSLLMDDGKILKPKTAKLLFTPLMTPVEKAALNEDMKHPEWAVGWIPPSDTGVEYDWGAGGLLSVGGEGLKHRKKGFLMWGGAWNAAWFIDREAGVCAVFGTQIIPPGDAFTRQIVKEFEEAIYSQL
ncbi:beta-lactamase/transpeptidase-like protein [Dichotomopilus funicola]|uniref:Beta-lactamase/transpeptidase-like protein n=1 Tax=Dichotomopilus funicola TaxID=1934379 RepID=A0AAN6V9C6_9PEZI|nr:beta-lactamase/transpeptidase-like protein [Dichotomopilus funicola]